MPDTVRTYDLQLRRLALYPTELRAHTGKVPLFPSFINSAARLYAELKI